MLVWFLILFLFFVAGAVAWIPWWALASLAGRGTRHTS